MMSFKSLAFVFFLLIPTHRTEFHFNLVYTISVQISSSGELVDPNEWNQLRPSTPCATVRGETPAKILLWLRHLFSFSTRPFRSLCCVLLLGCGVGGFWVESDTWEHQESDFFIGLQKSNWIILLYRAPKLGILTHACWHGTFSFETFIETENSCCAPRFPLIVSCYKIADSQTSFMLC